jgi:hypothetical protein
MTRYVLIGLAAIALVGMFAYGAHLQKEVGTLTSELAAAKIEEERLAVLVKDAVDACDLQLAAIRALEQSRQSDRASIDPFMIRINDLAKEPVTEPNNAAQNSFVDRLNGVNADVNRMLEQGTR